MAVFMILVLITMLLPLMHTHIYIQMYIVHSQSFDEKE